MNGVIFRFHLPGKLYLFISERLSRLPFIFASTLKVHIKEFLEAMNLPSMGLKGADVGRIKEMAN